MCRFLIYRGPAVTLAELVTEPSCSLIAQSFRAQERAEPLNGDGFGVGWYAPDIDPTPGVFTSISPAWSNRNLHSLAAHVRSGCFFAHVRAASPGLPVSNLNCHPFAHERLLWMHNGSIPGFADVKRRLRASLSDAAYAMIEGTTDSEHALALFVDRVARTGDLTQALVSTIQALERLTTDARVAGHGDYNFAVTDGRTVAASRFSSPGCAEAQTLYLARGDAFDCRDGQMVVTPASGTPRAAIVTSEPLTDDDVWEPVPRDHVVTISETLDVSIAPIA